MDHMVEAIDPIGEEEEFSDESWFDELTPAPPRQEELLARRLGEVERYGMILFQNITAAGLSVPPRHSHYTESFLRSKDRASAMD